MGLFRYCVCHDVFFSFMLEDGKAGLKKRTPTETCRFRSKRPKIMVSWHFRQHIHRPTMKQNRKVPPDPKLLSCSKCC